MAYQSLDLAMNPRPPSSYLSLLSEEIIFKICEHLDLYELLQIGEMDINYQRIIGERIIANKRPLDMMEIRKHYDVRAAFKQLGRFTTELAIAESSIQYKDNKYTFMQEILRLINKRCTIGQLKTVQIILDKKSTDPILDDGDQIPDVFQKIRALNVFSDTYKRKNGAERLVETLLSKCLELHLLSLIGINGHANYLIDSNLRNLTSLSLDFCKISLSTWQQFIEIGLPHLKSLTILDCEFIGSPDNKIARSLQPLATTFPKLREITFQNWFLEFQTGFELVETLLLKCLVLYDLSLGGLKGHGNYLLTPNLHSLTTLNLKSCNIHWRVWSQFITIGFPGLNSLNIDDCHFTGLPDKITTPFLESIVTACPQLEELVINESTDSWLSYNAQAFENLRALENLSIDFKVQPNIFDALAKQNTIQNLRIRCQNLNESYSSIKHLTNLESVSFDDVSDANIPMVIEFLKLPQLKKCSLNGGLNENIVSTVVISSPHLKIFEAYDFQFNITARFYKTLATKRQRLFPNQPLHLYASYSKAIHKHPLPSIVMHSLR